MKKFQLIAIIALLVSVNTYAQDTINFLNGKIKYVEVVPFDNDSLVKNVFIKKKSGKIKEVKKDNVFNVVFHDGKEVLIYKQDSLDDNYFTVEQARMYLLGAQDARKHYHSHFSKIFSVGVGAAGVSLAWYGLSFPVISLAAQDFLFKPNLTVRKGVSESYKENQYYLAGFERAARNKKVASGFIYGYIGYIAMVIITQNTK